MEDSAFNAIYTGVYVFIFVIALTATIFLYRSVSEYADVAYDFSHKIDGSALIIGSEVERNRILNGDEVINYYYNYIKKDQYGTDKENSKYIVSINLAGNDEPEKILTNTDLSYKELAERIGMNNKYIVNYVKETADQKAIIQITRINQSVDENGDTLVDQVW